MRSRERLNAGFRLLATYLRGLHVSRGNFAVNAGESDRSKWFAGLVVDDCEGGSFCGEELQHSIKQGSIRRAYCLISPVRRRNHLGPVIQSSRDGLVLELAQGVIGPHKFAHEVVDRAGEQLD